MIHFSARETHFGAEVDVPIGMHHDHMLDMMNALGFVTADMFLSESIGLGDGIIRYLFKNRT